MDRHIYLRMITIIILDCIFLFLAEYNFEAKLNSRERCEKIGKSLTNDDDPLSFECNQRLLYGQYLTIQSYKLEEQSGSWFEVESDIEIREAEIEFYAPRKYIDLQP